MTSQSVQELVAQLAQMQQRITDLERAQRTPQLPTSALGPGQFIGGVDENGDLIARIGFQPDGGFTLRPEPGTGEAPPTPSAPILTPSIGGIRVVWDGRLVDAEGLDVVRPSDLAHVAVEVAPPAGGFVWEGTITEAGTGGMLPVLPLAYAEHRVRLVAVTTSGLAGPPGAEASATPLQVEGPDLVAGSVTAGHIAAGAVEADKLAAIIALVTRIVAGDPAGARVELNASGLRAYSAAGVLTVAIDSSTGDAVFTGTITGSEITGSRFSLAATSGATGVMQETADMVLTRVTSPTLARAQLAATGSQAEFSVWGNAANPDAPGGGLVATPDGAVLVMYSKSGDTTAPFTQTTAVPGEAWALWRSATGSEVRIRSLPDWSSISLTAPAATDPADAQGEGFIYTQRYASDIAATSIQGPVWATGSGPERGMRSMLHTEGARPERPYTRMTYSGARHVFQQQWNMQAENRDTADGVVELASTMSLTSSRHAPVRSELTNALATFSTGSAFYDFPTEVWPSFTFTTSWSGRVRVTVMLSGLNSASDNSSISLGFRLSGGSTVAASLKRCALVRSAGAGFGSSQQATYVDTLSLAGNSTYTVTPCYRITSGTVAWFDLALANHIIIEPLT